jgi:hypothetical protein
MNDEPLEAIPRCLVSILFRTFLRLILPEVVAPEQSAEAEIGGDFG